MDYKQELIQVYLCGRSFGVILFSKQDFCRCLEEVYVKVLLIPFAWHFGGRKRRRIYVNMRPIKGLQVLRAR